MKHYTQLGSTVFVAGAFTAHALGVKLPAAKTLQYESLQYIKPAIVKYIKPPLFHAEQWTGYESILHNDAIVTVTSGAISYSPGSLPAFGSGTMPE